jgi:hypothetical protein
MKKLLTASAFLLFVSCEHLEFYGDTFFTIKGKLIDANNLPVSNLNLRIYAEKTVSFPSENGKTTNAVVSGTGKTDANGNFLITYPKSNGQNYLLLEDGYVIIDSVTKKSFQTNLAKINTAKINDFLFDFRTIKINAK